MTIVTIVREHQVGVDGFSDSNTDLIAAPS
jgi:hypothetical protein